MIYWVAVDIERHWEGEVEAEDAREAEARAIEIALSEDMDLEPFVFTEIISTREEDEQ